MAEFYDKNLISRASSRTGLEAEPASSLGTPAQEVSADLSSSVSPGLSRFRLWEADGASSVGQVQSQSHGAGRQLLGSIELQPHPQNQSDSQKIPSVFMSLVTRY